MSGRADQAQETDEIGDLPIDPGSEPPQRHPPKVTGRQENDFYTRSGREHALQENAQNLGALGRFFGAPAIAPTNIAGIIALAMGVFFILSFFAESTVDVVEGRKLALGTLSSALAFIFGAATKK